MDLELGSKGKGMVSLKNFDVAVVHFEHGVCTLMSGFELLDNRLFVNHDCKTATCSSFVKK